MKLLILIPKLAKKEFLYILILSIFVFLSSKALFHDGFFRTIDDITTVRINYLEKELTRNNWVNNFPVRISAELSNNFGYPLYLFYAPLTYYVGASLKIFLSLSDIVATKYVYVFPLIFGPFALYFAARQKVQPPWALIAAIAYTLFPYRGSNTYVRGAAPEAWAISLIPLAMAGIFLIQKNRRFGGLIFAVGYSLILITHILVGLQFTALVLLFGSIFLLKNKRFWQSAALGIGAAAFYLLPMIYYLKIIKVTYVDVNTTYLLQTLEPINNLLKVPVGEFVWRVSGVFFYLLVGGLTYLLYKKRRGEKHLKETLFWGITGLVLYLLLFDSFKFIWEITLPLTGILQFAWRILALEAFIIPLFLGLWLAHIKNTYFRAVLVVIIVAAALNFLPSFKPEAYSYFYEYKPEGPCATTSWQDEYLPLWVKGCPQPRNPLELRPEGKINLLGNNPLDISAEVETKNNSDLIVNKYYFPGWHLSVDGKKAALDYTFSTDGIFKTTLAPGKHNVEVVYKKTPIMWIADLISAGSFALLFYFLLRRHRK
ncbi:MAG: 6-pyruvoyl-tetrahydropterin synthase-related protein [Candidatus Curtissbacteria bacterium]